MLDWACGKNLIFNPYGGNVGIGTATPEAKLDIVSATGGDGLIVESSITSPSGVLAEFCNDSATPDGTLLLVMSGPSDDTRFKINADGTAYFSGNVGIGTTSPTEKLDVSGNMWVRGKATIGGGHTNTGGSAFVAGASNEASGAYSTVGGGQNNTASHSWARVSFFYCYPFFHFLLDFSVFTAYNAAS